MSKTTSNKTLNDHILKSDAQTRALLMMNYLANLLNGKDDDENIMTAEEYDLLNSSFKTNQDIVVYNSFDHHFNRLHHYYQHLEYLQLKQQLTLNQVCILLQTVKGHYQLMVLISTLVSWVEHLDCQMNGEDDRILIPELDKIKSSSVE